MPLQTAERLALQHQRDLATIAGATTSVVASVALGADPATISTWYFGVVDGLLARIQAGHAQARLSSTQFLAKHAAMNGVDLTPVPASLNMERARTSLRVTGPVAFQTAMRAGQDEERAIRSMATQMAGSSQRLVLAGDRDTFEQTLNAGKGVIGWRRRLAGKSCGFCAMLASRGAVYETRKSATQAKDGLAFHDHCNCWAEPMYKHETEPPEVRLLQRQWRNVTAGKRGNSAARAWRQHWEENVSPVERERLGMAAAKAAPSPIPGPPVPTPGVVVRSALDSKKTLGGLEQAWTAEARRITGRDLDVVIPPGTSLQTAKEYAEGVLRGMERFPDSALQRIRFGQMAQDHYAEAGGIDIEFNERWATIPNRPGLQQGIARDIEGWAQGVNGWGARGGGTTLAVALHEFGHIVDINDLGKRGATLGVIARHAAREGIGPDELIARDISVYATTHPKELVAEAFMDVMLRGEAASPAAREIFDLLEAEYFRAGGRITPSFGTFPSKAMPIRALTPAEFEARASAARTGRSAERSPLVQAEIDARSGDSATWKATGFSGLEKPAPGGTTAVTRYLRSVQVNEHLRFPAGKPMADWEVQLRAGYSPEMRAQLEAADLITRQKFVATADSTTRGLDRLMAQSPLQGDTVVWRGARVSDLKIPEDAVGFTWTDPAFVSTTAQRSVAESSFATGSDSALFRILAPDGTPALGFEGLGEAEVLLNRGLTFRIVAEHDRLTVTSFSGKKSPGARVFDVEIVPVAKPAAVVDVSKLSVADLRALAKERGVSLPPKALKADIVRALEEGPSLPLPPTKRVPGKAAVSDSAGRSKPPAGVVVKGRDVTHDEDLIQRAFEAGKEDGVWSERGGRWLDDEGGYQAHLIIARKLGFDGLPKTVDSNGFGWLQDRDWGTELYRGWGWGTDKKGTDLAEQFLHGPLHVGGGHGLGTNMSNQLEEALIYASEDRFTRIPNSALVAFRLAPGARVASFPVIKAERDAYLAALPKGPAGEAARAVFDDVGTFAMARGYDAMVVREGESILLKSNRGVEEWVIFNRTKLVALDETPLANLSKLKVADLRTMAAERQIPIPAKATKAELVRLVQSTPDEIKALQQKAIRDAARERNRLIESSTGTARLLAEVDELISKGASKATILQRLDPKLTAPDQVFAGADAEIVKALRVAVDTGDTAKLRTALTRAGTKAKVKPISKAGVKVKFDPASMESVGGQIADGAQVVVVTRGSTLTLPDGSTMQLTKAKVTAVAKPLFKPLSRREIAIIEAKREIPDLRVRLKALPAGDARRPIAQAQLDNALAVIEQKPGPANYNWSSPYWDDPGGSRVLRPPTAPELAKHIDDAISPVIPSGTRADLTRELERQAELTPRSMLHFRGVEDPANFDLANHANSYAYYSSSFRWVSIKPDWTRTRTALEHSYAGDISSGWHPPTGAPSMLEAVLSHEYGHHVTYRLIEAPLVDQRRMIKLLDETFGLNGHLVREFRRDPDIKKVITDFVSGPYGVGRIDRAVSRYARKDYQEFFAEVWSEYTTMGDKARPQVKAIGEMMLRMAELSDVVLTP